MRITILLGLALVSSRAAASPRGWDQASNIGRDTIVAAALLVPAAQGDWNGDLQAAGSMAASEAAAWSLKQTFPEERPDGSGRDSFPSGHSAIAFAAAASLEKRYGWQAGLPAFAVATFVGVARERARKHHWYDVVAGAGIGTASGYLITSRRNSAVRLLPWGDAHGGGVAVAALW